MTIVDLGAARQKREQHSSGKARCLDCKHEWVAVAPTGTPWLECPSCTLFRGRFVEHHEHGDKAHWECRCGNELFYILADGCLCPNCGRYQTGV